MMSKLLGSALLVLGLCLGARPARAQNAPAPAPAAAEPWQTVFFESPAVALPLLTAAVLKHSAQLRSLEINKTIGLEDLKITRKNILNAVSVGTNYNYGSLVNIAGVSGPGTQLATTGEGRYSVNVGLGLSVGQLATRGNQMQKERLNVQRNEEQRQSLEDQLRQQVIPLYQNVRLARRLLTLQQEAYVTVQTNFRLSERQFRQGQLALPDFAQATGQVNAASVAQETARSQYETAFMALEELAGAKISTLITAAR